MPNFGYPVGWVEKHPRFLADTTGDGRKGIVGFGDGGVWVSRNLGAGKFEAPQLVVTNFGLRRGRDGGSSSTRGSSPTPRATGARTSSGSGTPASGTAGPEPSATDPARDP
ncbi:hypothetical protein SAMN04488564_113265 [Lentzea waywayandensis]|uniref:Uncharacterized protein n=1 Tax=Lentzea waywayandensis TaxID=84724 RepID=A0A1I6FF66_9PSEU|nr:hypothetical protein [Lentzea waywayandensis]SFR28417.1 hypothetical protein SAMN04488564_113265 [Lentzea waywayandensis]